MIDVATLYVEVSGYLSETDVHNDGDRLISNYERVAGILVRLQQIRNDISYQELFREATPEVKKFRTTILDPTIETFEKLATFESRKITARVTEANLERS